ncbi:hypothetical protein J6590_023631 [Homalodisca vitripennis]|nr:hypothetical protein J6590_023631 [Homalodisca vitripennis]
MESLLLVSDPPLPAQRSADHSSQAFIRTHLADLGSEKSGPVGQVTFRNSGQLDRLTSVICGRRSLFGLLSRAAPLLGHTIRA